MLMFGQPVTYAGSHAGIESPSGGDATSSLSRDPGRRIPALDGIRGIAIVAVLFYHTGIWGVMAVGTLPATMVERWLFAAAARGYLGVDLFFALSGFLITGILYDSKGRSDYLRRFYTRRALRIFPLYYAVLFLLVFVAPLVYHHWQVVIGGWSSVWAWAYLLNVEIVAGPAKTPTVFLHLWSLCVEEQFYMIWPFVVLACSRRGLLRLCLALFAGTIAIRYLLGPVFPGRPVNWLMPARLDALAAGSFVAALLRGSIDVAAVRRWAQAIGAAALAVFLVNQAIDLTSPIPIAAVLAGAVLAWIALSDSDAPIPVVSRPIPRFFGKYSYAIYLLHQPIALFLLQVIPFKRVGDRYGLLPASALMFGLVCAASIVAALISWHTLEKHFLKLKDRRSVPRRPEVTQAKAA